MGIQGLLPFLKKASREVNIKDFTGITVGVDVYCWLHKGVFSCAEKLVKGEKTDGYVMYCMKMVNVLLGAGIKPVLVFDGRHLPSKKVTEQKRRENREKNRKKAKEYLQEGKLKEARECFQRSVDITSEMAHELIKACQQKGVDYIVAPYESDAQLAYLNKIGIVQLVITEDSDLVLFGCEKILFKMDTGGRGILVEKTKIPVTMGKHAESFTFDKFRYMCILSGCDYLPSLPGIGLAKSCKFFSLTTNPNLEMVLPKIPTYLKMPNLEVSSEYKENFIKANNTFLYQLVFCPLQRRLVPLNPYSEDIEPETLSYAGEYFDDALQFALGNLHVHTMKPVDNFDPDKAKIPKSMTWSGKENSMLQLSIWDKNYKVSDSSKEKLKNVSRIPTTRGKVLTLETDQILQCIKPTKRTRENKVLAPVNPPPSNEELFSIYMSSSPNAKKSKVESNEEGSVLEVIAETPEKSKTILNKFKVDGNKPSSTPVVRSRFFFKSPPQENTKDYKNEQSKVSWLDEIDQQYNSLQIDLSAVSWQQRKKVVNDENVKLEGHDPEVETSANFGSTSNKEEKSSFLDEIETSFDDSLLSLTPRNSRSFQWKRDKLQTLFSFQKNNPSMCLQSSPACQSDYKPICPLGDNSDGSQGLSPLTNCSIDQESFHLSQDSGKLSESQPCNSFLDDEEVAPLSSTPISHNSSSPSQVIQQTDDLVSTATQKIRYSTGKKYADTGKCRRTGLSKKSPQTTTGTKKQLSLKESLSKFQFERKNASV